MQISVAQLMPGLYRAAEKVTDAGQKRFRRLTKAILSLLIVAAVAGAINANWAGWVAAAALATSIVCTLLWAFRSAESDWYDGRAAAESAKSLTWKYAVGADPFGVAVDSATSDYLEALRSIATELQTLDSALEPPADASPHDELAALRADSLSVRRAIYREQRLDEQRGWYARRAREQREAARNWQYGMVTFQVLGVAAGALKGLDVVEIDLLSVLAAVAAAAAAWINALDFTMTARAYQFAALELDNALGRIDSVTTEEEWAVFAADTEEAMSREHTMWRARRRSRRF